MFILQRLNFLKLGSYNWVRVVGNPHGAGKYRLRNWLECMSPAYDLICLLKGGATKNYNGHII